MLARLLWTPRRVGHSSIRLPLVVTGSIVSAARENLGAAQTFPGPHCGLDEPWLRADGHAVGVGNRPCRRHGPCEGACVDCRKIERREGVGKLLRLLLAPLR